jgi:hypothetical protein
MEKFALFWDERRPLMIEVLGPGTWSDEDHAAYLVLLASLLVAAPPAGFDMLSDCLQYTMQVDADADHESYDMLASAGCRRIVMAVTKMSIALQVQRMIRESGVGQSLEFIHVKTMEEAEDVAEGWQRA